MWARSRTLVAMGVSIVGAGVYMVTQERIQASGGYSSFPFSPECTGSTCPVSMWDHNWDLMEPKDMDEKPHHVRRHVILIRNGQYNVGAQNEEDKGLTELGSAQVRAAATRLVALNLPYSYLVGSPTTRGKQSFDILAEHLKPHHTSMVDTLVEGFPVEPSPPAPGIASDFLYHKDSMRLEHAFRTIFRRPNVRRTTDKYEVYVCSANAIRYFVCRALQFPPQGWLRFEIAHGSLTWIVVDYKGYVSVKSISDHGFLPPNTVTY